MKRVAAILLMGILLFNWIGFRWITSYMEDRANTRLEAQLDDNNYDESELISIKVPALNLAYYTPSIRFERIDGQIQIGNIQYKYVKKRLYNDSVEMLCIPNREAMESHVANENFFRSVNDLQQTDQGKKSNSRGANLKDLSVDQYIIDELFTTTRLSHTIEKKHRPFMDALASCYRPAPAQPPEKIS